MKIIFASSNVGKQREIQHYLAPLSWQLVLQAEHQVNDIEETGSTFVENALLKARHACRVTGCAALADDSGLVVTALHGAPGIFSARYAGPQADAKKNIEKVLHEMHDIQDEKRSAYFYCVLVWLQHADDPTPVIAEGVWQGKILTTPLGDSGFGYDPIFYVPEYDCSAAQLSLDIKNKISHRAKALQQLLEKCHDSGRIATT